MTLESIALWLGYGVMVCAAVALLALVLFVLSYICARSANKGLWALIRSYDLNTLRSTMRQLEAEGKVIRKSEVKNG